MASLAAGEHIGGGADDPVCGIGRRAGQLDGNDKQ
jgi:hypothetical protein